jgi:hypothetical protein
MGTRSRIGVQLPDNHVLSVYCHWDGYPSFNGRVLREFFNTTSKVAELINGGNISALYTNAGWKNETLPESGPLYYTERGETLESNMPQLSKDHESFMKLTDNTDGEYSYLFKNGEWVCYNARSWDDDYLQEIAIPEGSIRD